MIKYTTKEEYYDYLTLHGDALTAVIHRGSALQFQSDEFRNDREIVLAAVQQNGYALQFANDRFQKMIKRS
jgi:hypothetical protein